MKTFRVCHSSELPVSYLRNPNYVYFAYDKLMLFDGQNIFYDHFAIVEEVPEEPVEALWYICFDGKIRSLIDYSITEIAEIEDESMIDLLYKAGTIFFYEANRRYLDTRRQLLELPYLNGSYQMTINLANNIKLDENTVIAFNPETSEFEISGKPQDYDLIFTHDYQGIDTDKVSTDVTDRKITTDIKISEGYDNIIRVVSDGLYASVLDRVTKTAFDEWVAKFERYRESLAEFLETIGDEIEELEERLSPEAITARIMVVLEDKYDEIDYALEHFNQWASRLDGMEERCNQYTDNKFDSSYTALSDQIDDATNDPWESFGDLNPIPEP